MTITRTELGGQSMTNLREQAGESFQGGFRGQLFAPDDDGYDEARKIYNAMIDKRPGLIARCADVADVMSSVNPARDHGWTLAVRGGGHNGAGLGTCDDGLVIDLSQMKGIQVDPTKRIARISGGCTWRDADHATHAFGLAVPGGVISTTGVAGLTLGGGIGYLSRKHGLSIDNLLSVDMVLADGSFVQASEEENADLFWAVRGGGGNSGSLPLSSSGSIQSVRWLGGPHFGHWTKPPMSCVSTTVSSPNHPTI